MLHVQEKQNTLIDDMARIKGALVQTSAEDDVHHLSTHQNIQSAINSKSSARSW